MFVHQKSLLAQHFASKNFVDPVESLPPLSVPYCFLKDLTFLSLLVDIKYNIIFIYCSWFVFALFLHGLHSYSSNIWRILSELKPSEKALSQELPGAPPPRPLPGPYPKQLGGLAAPPRPPVVWALTQSLCACWAPSFPLIRCNTRKIHHTCPSTQNAQFLLPL